MNENASNFIKLVSHPVKFRLFLLSRLPSAYFAGLRVREMNEERCVVTIPYKWFTRNPFRSTYFACLSMAAEMSTGALAMAHLYKRNPSVSMLVLKVESIYLKKATGITTFTCEDGMFLRNAIIESANTGDSKEYRASSIGRNNAGEIIAEFYVTWSFKARV